MLLLAHVDEYSFAKAEMSKLMFKDAHEQNVIRVCKKKT